MQPVDFARWVSDYYGAIPQGQKADFWAYIRNMSPDYLDALRKVLVRKYSSTWGKVPDVAILESLKEQASAEMAYRKYLPPAEEELITKEQAERFWADFERLVAKKKMEAQS